MKAADIIALIALVLSSLLSILALLLALRLGGKQEALQRELATKGTVSQEQLAAKSNELQQTIHDAVDRADNRRFFSTVLWDKMIAIADIDPANPVGPDIRRVVNLLELVAMAWEGKIVDRTMVLVSFGRLYNDFFDKVSRTNVVPAKADGSGPSGSQLLNANPLIGKVNSQIIQEFEKRSAITS